jgi:hypothetical protein
MVLSDSIGDRLRKYITDKYRSINAFADSIGMHPGNVQKYLSNKRKPGSPLLKILKNDGVNIDWLLTGEGEMYGDAVGEKKPYSPGIQQTFTVNEMPVESLLFKMPAIGPNMTPDKIEEGDTLIIDREKTPIDGDYVLIGSQEGPIIRKWKPGEQILGVVITLVRDHVVLCRKKRAEPFQ